jgi:hypothetical protein
MRQESHSTDERSNKFWAIVQERHTLAKKKLGFSTGFEGVLCAARGEPGEHAGRHRSKPSPLACGIWFFSSER